MAAGAKRVCFFSEETRPYLRFECGGNLKFVLPIQGCPDSALETIVDYCGRPHFPLSTNGGSWPIVVEGKSVISSAWKINYSLGCRCNPRTMRFQVSQP